MTRGEADVVSSDNAEFDVVQETAHPHRQRDHDLGYGPAGHERQGRARSARRHRSPYRQRRGCAGRERAQGQSPLHRPQGRAYAAHVTRRAAAVNGRIFGASLPGRSQAAGRTESGEDNTSSPDPKAVHSRSRPIRPRRSKSKPTSSTSNDAAKVAIFQGNVNATQGGFTISSAELHAFYKGGSGLADVTRSEIDHSGPSKTGGRHRADADRGEEERRRHVQGRADGVRRLGRVRRQVEQGHGRRRRRGDPGPEHGPRHAARDRYDERREQDRHGPRERPSRSQPAAAGRRKRLRPAMPRRIAPGGRARSSSRSSSRRDKPARVRPRRRKHLRPRRTPGGPHRMDGRRSRIPMPPPQPEIDMTPVDRLEYARVA